MWATLQINSQSLIGVDNVQWAKHCRVFPSSQ